MSVPIGAVGIKTKPSQPAPAGTRLHGPWLVVAWGAWSLLTLLSLINFISSIAFYLARVHVPCQPGSCVASQPATATASMLRQFGLSSQVYAAMNIGFVCLGGLIYCVVAAVIIWRKPYDWMALLVTSTFITQGLFEIDYLPSPFSIPTSPWYVAGLWLSYISPIQVLFLCALFPNGRFAPRWTGWLLIVVCLIDLPANLFPTLPLSNPIETVFVFSGFPLAVGSMIYRYRRVSTLMERQQTKWAVFGGAVTFVGFMLWFTPQIILYSSLSQPGSLYDILGHPLLLLSSVALPICLGIAVLRYRLFDIDVIINRTLVYGSLSAVLAAIYFACVIGTQAIIQAVTGSTNTPPVLIVASTLLVIVLFNPLRHRIQKTIDRRFYRRKYDAQKTLAAFGAVLRSEVELTALQIELTDVVIETMQPTQVSLWLRTPEAGGQPATDSILRGEPWSGGTQI